MSAFTGSAPLGGRRGRASRTGAWKGGRASPGVPFSKSSRNIKIGGEQNYLSPLPTLCVCVHRRLGDQPQRPKPNASPPASQVQSLSILKRAPVLWRKTVPVRVRSDEVQEKGFLSGEGCLQPSIYPLFFLNGFHCGSQKPIPPPGAVAARVV